MLKAAVQASRISEKGNAGRMIEKRMWVIWDACCFDKKPLIADLNTIGDIAGVLRLASEFCKDLARRTQILAWG